MLRSARAFMTFLDNRGLQARGGSTLAQLQLYCDRNAERFATEMDNPANYGLAKGLFAQAGGLEAGQELDEDSLNAVLARMAGYAGRRSRRPRADADPHRRPNHLARPARVREGRDRRPGPGPAATAVGVLHPAGAPAGPEGHLVAGRRPASGGTARHRRRTRWPGRTLATGTGSGESVRLWGVADPANPTPLGQPLTGHTNTVFAVAFSPDRRTLATSSTDHTARLWNLPLTSLTGHTGTVESVTFSPDGRTLASGGFDGSVRLWNVADPASPTPLGQPLTGHTDYVRPVAFGPDGRTLASGSGDGSVRLWDVADPANPTPLGQPLTGHTNAVGAVAFSPDGRTLATGSSDRTVRLWGLNVDQVIERICATTRNTLTPGKWKQYVSQDLPYDPPCS
ncbi:MAG: WD40 repeat domain-containing protein [Pseudonocardiaceae bacterium]